MIEGSAVNPQVENGHIELATEIWEALCRIRVPGEAMQVLLFIIRKTYGWKKKNDSISLSQFISGTGINQPNICRALKKLRGMNLISIIQKDNSGIPKYMFNKHYDTWKPLSKKITLSKKIIGIIQKDKKVLSKKIHTKDISTIDTTTKETKDKDIEQPKKPVAPDGNKKPAPDPRIKEFIDYFFQEHKQRFGVGCVINGGKEGNLIKKILSVHDLPKLKELCIEFFESNDEFLKKAGKTIGTFFTHINKLAQKEKQENGWQG